MTDTESRAADLLLCPFCGGKASIEEVNGDKEERRSRWTVGCNEVTDEGAVLCYGYQSLTTFATKHEAIAAWNRRALTTSAAAETAMREALTETTAEAIEHRKNIVEAKVADFHNAADPRYQTTYDHEIARFDALIGRAKAALALPASAQAERMMQIIEAGNALCENVRNNGSHDNWKSLANALRALGETEET